MTEYAPIAPIDCLLKIQQAGFLGNYLVLLAHEVVAEAEKYEKLIENFSGTIILDNSLIELGEPVDVETMIAAVDITGADYCVLADKLLDMDGTIESSTTALRQWKEFGLNSGYVIVAQGKTVRECLTCVESIVQELEEDDKYIISIPRALVNELGSRMPVIEGLIQIGFDDIPIHLLGFSSNYHDDITCTRHPNVMGIDSATPIRLGFEGKVLPISSSEADSAAYLQREREDFFKNCKSFNSLTAYNIGMVRGAIRVFWDK